jgi:hypothetical protein
MSTPEQPAQWYDVDTVEQFTAFLQRMAEQVHEAKAGDDDAPLPLADPALEEFLWAWTHVLGDGLSGRGPLLQDQDGHPGWRGLAFQIHIALTTAPNHKHIPADSGLDVDSETVSTAHELLQFLGALAIDLSRDQREMREREARGQWAGDGGSWAYYELDYFLDAWARWLSSYLRPHPWPKPSIEPVTWQSIAVQIQAARIYE